jgi:hypothetical protein
MTKILSRREAGRVAGVSHQAISKAILRGVLCEDSTGGVDPVALARWMATRRRGRGRGNLPGGGVTVSTPPAVAIGSDAPSAVRALAAIARRWPDDFATAILPHLSDTMTKALYARARTE